MTIGEFLPMWLADRTDPHSGGKVLRASTAEGYEKHLRLYLVPRLGRVKVRDLTAEHIEGLYRWMREQGKSEAPVRHVHATLRSAITYAVRKGYLPSDGFMRRVELRPVEDYQANPWTPDEWATFRAHAEPSRYWPLLLLAVDAGMRRGELCGLRWSSVDLDAGKVTVEHTRTEVGGKVVDGKPKSGKPRDVFVTPGTVTVLRAWRKQQAEERLRLGEAYTDSGLVFTDEAGAGYLPGSVSQAFDRLDEQAGVRRCRFHDLRHLSAVLGIAAGESSCTRCLTGSVTRRCRSPRRCTRICWTTPGVRRRPSGQRCCRPARSGPCLRVGAFSMPGSCTWWTRFPRNDPRKSDILRGDDEAVGSFVLVTAVGRAGLEPATEGL